MRRLIALWIGLIFAGSASATEYRTLIDLAQDWRNFVTPEMRDCLPDYGKASITRKSNGLKDFRARLAKIGRTGWTKVEEDDYRLIEAEMNGLDFDLRILRPWARDPSFYATISGEQSDVPAHEGNSAEPVIDLF